MERTPERPEVASFAIAADLDSSPRRSPRIRKPPPITPRRFTRFFAPRFKPNDGTGVRTSRAALRSLSGPALNSRQNGAIHSNGILNIDVPKSNKKRKLSISSPASSLLSSPIKRVGFLNSSQEPIPEEGDNALQDEDPGSISEASTALESGSEAHMQTLFSKHSRHTISKVTRFGALSTSAAVMSLRLSGRRARKETEKSRLWEYETADFVSLPNDVNADNGALAHPLGLPFCATSCKTNPLAAVGDEEGIIRIVDAANESSKNFVRSYLVMKPHDNAIMDLEFSDDDAYLASASGDQTCHVIDMKTQTSLWCLSGHTSSIKRVQFQPGVGNNVLATCARDGNVNFWDLRCSPIDRPSFHLRSCIIPEMAQSTRYQAPTNTIRDAHTGKIKKIEGKVRLNPVPGRNDFSVTSLSFVSETRPHLIVTASENDAIVKLWDMRTAYKSRRSRPAPVSCTREPRSHQIHRRCGITSISMNTDGSRLYALCRDHTVYAYSTPHLVLGGSPETPHSSSRSFRPSAKAQQGLGPLYCFRHPALRISTFYPKLAIRKATDAHTELLAVGSSDDCAVIFPTSERYLTRETQCMTDLPPSHAVQRPRPWPRLLPRKEATVEIAQHRRTLYDDFRTYYHGTVLTHGHTKEVTAVTWTSEGNLLTASDDYTTRCWREDRDMVRQLRKGDDGEGGRLGTGWAAVREWGEFSGGFDKSEDD